MKNTERQCTFIELKMRKDYAFQTTMSQLYLYKYIYNLSEVEDIPVFSLFVISN
jgi:hypothetical protein